MKNWNRVLDNDKWPEGTIATYWLLWLLFMDECLLKIYQRNRLDRCHRVSDECCRDWQRPDDNTTFPYSNRFTMNTPFYYAFHTHPHVIKRERKTDERNQPGEMANEIGSELHTNEYGETHTTQPLAVDWYIFRCTINGVWAAVEQMFVIIESKKACSWNERTQKEEKGTHIGRVSCTCDKDQFGRAHLGRNRTANTHRCHCCAFLVASRSISRLLHSIRNAYNVFTLTSNSGLIIFLANASFARI